MKCPKCKDQALKEKIPHSPAHCNCCGGIWLEHENIPHFIDSIKASSNNDEASNLNDEKTGLCPLGHGIMLRAKIDVEEPFYLEKCGACGGIWFDNGEWQRVVNNDLAEKLNLFWCKSWQVQQRKEKDRQNYLDTNKKLLGDNLFNELMKLSVILQDHPEQGRAMALLQEEISK